MDGSLSKPLVAQLSREAEVFLFNDKPETSAAMGARGGLRLVVKRVMSNNFYPQCLLLRTIKQLGMSQHPAQTMMRSLFIKSGRWRFRQATMNPAESLARTNDSTTDNSSYNELWNPDLVLRRMGDDKALLCSMVDYFQEDSPGLLQQLQDLIRVGDAAESSRIAHSLKGLCSNFDAHAAINVASDTENACRAGSFTDAVPLLNSLNEEIRKLVPALTQWQSENSE